MNVQELIAQLGKFCPTDTVTVRSPRHEKRNDYFTNLTSVAELEVFPDSDCYRYDPGMMEDQKNAKNRPFITLLDTKTTRIVTIT